MHRWKGPPQEGAGCLGWLWPIQEECLGVFNPGAVILEGEEEAQRREVGPEVMQLTGGSGLGIPASQPRTPPAQAAFPQAAAAKAPQAGRALVAAR